LAPCDGFLGGYAQSSILTANRAIVCSCRSERVPRMAHLHPIDKGRCDDTSGRIGWNRRLVLSPSGNESEQTTSGLTAMSVISVVTTLMGLAAAGSSSVAGHIKLKQPSIELQTVKIEPAKLSTGTDGTTAESVVDRGRSLAAARSARSHQLILFLGCIEIPPCFRQCFRGAIKRSRERFETEGA
jgi:hypothetical protein